MTALIASVALILLPAAPAHAGPLSSTPLITYNMQGATNGVDSKWTVDVGRFIRMAEIVAVQEAGSTPPGDHVATFPFPQLPQVGRAGSVEHHNWTFQQESYDVYFLQTDAHGGNYVGGRVNIALVTHRPADEVTVVVNPDQNGRPALGVRFNDDWYFTFHGRSLGGQPNDSAGMLTAIDAHVNMVPGREWTVMGDFNSEPASFPIPIGSTIYNTGQPTHQSGGELDFAVSSTGIPNHPVQRLNGASADHYPVGIGAMRGAAEPRETLFNSPRVIENMANGEALESESQSTNSGAPITISDRTGNANQEWDIEFNNTDTVTLRLGSGGKCIEPFLSFKDHALAYRMRLNDCSFSVGEQQWKLVSLGNEQYQIRNVPFGGCMDVVRSNSPKPGAPSLQIDLRLEPCVNVPGQHWLLTPSDNPVAAPDFYLPELSVAYDSSSGLENASTGHMLASERGPAVNPIRAWPRGETTPEPNLEEWKLTWVASGELMLGDGVSCLNLSGPNEKEGGYEVKLGTCSSTVSSAVWKVRPTGENTFALESKQSPITGTDPVCLTEVPAKPGTPLFLDGGVARATSCPSSTTPATPTMHWFFSPFDTSTPAAGGEP